MVLSTISSVLMMIVVGRTSAPVDAFLVSRPLSPRRTSSSSSSSCGSTTKRASLEVDSSSSSSEPSPATSRKTLGLLTFDLDDTLYPIDVVIDEANMAFVKAMKRFGYENIQTSDIIEASRRIRKDMAPEEALLLSHSEVRSLAIRKVMEDITFERRLQAMAEDFSCAVEDLSPLVVGPAKEWTKQAVSSSTVDAVGTAWEMERHHASERNLYPEVIDSLKQIKETYPDVLIGAVTDGRANPLLMTFTLMKYFDFCLGWEDDQSGRSNFFNELNNVEGNAELSWIYNAALEKANGMAQAKAIMNGGDVKVVGTDSLWIHVGDDLAFDVGGAASCGAKTILVELDVERYGQTSRLRFDDTNEEKQPTWSTSPKKELDARVMMNAAALKKVDKKIVYLSRLPFAVDEIVDEANEI